VDIPAPILADRAEFVDALGQLRHGLTLVRDAGGGSCTLAGAPLRHAFEPLLAYGLIDEVPRPANRARARCYRLNSRGREFAERVCTRWREQPAWRRLLLRITG
jgi:hypothetical protein